jgi:hypothetical protein
VDDQVQCGSEYPRTLEGIERIEEDLALPIDAYRRPEAPWFQEGQRRETAQEFKGFLWNRETNQEKKKRKFG